MKLSRAKCIAIVLVCFLLGAGILTILTTRKTIDTNDTINTKILTGGGNSYNATIAGLQSALATANHILLPKCNITITDTLIIPTGTWLQGSGNKTVLYLQTNLNKTMLVMNNKTRISDLTLDGNCLNQNAFYRGTRSSLHPLIWFADANDIIIQNCNLTNAQCVGIYGGNYYGKRSTNITIDNVKVYNAGAHLKAHSLLAYYSSGMWFENCTKIRISNCCTLRCYSCGYIFETGVDSAESKWTSNFTVVNCIAEQSCIGFYAECAKNGLIRNCIALYCTDTTIYGSAFAFMISWNTKNIKISNCIVIKSGTINGVRLFNFRR